MEQWIHRIIIYVIASTILVGITQNSVFQNYIKFFSGVLLILLTAVPVITAFSSQAGMVGILEESMMQVDKAEIEDFTKLIQKQKMKGLRSLWNEKVAKRVEKIVKSQGMNMKKINVMWGKKGEIKKIGVHVYGQIDNENVKECLRHNLCNKMDLGEEQVAIWMEK